MEKRALGRQTLIRSRGDRLLPVGNRMSDPEQGQAPWPWTNVITGAIERLGGPEPRVTSREPVRDRCTPTRWAVCMCASLPSALPTVVAGGAAYSAPRRFLG